MLVGVAFSPSLNPTLWNIGILHYKQAKLPKQLQHSVPESKDPKVIYPSTLKIDLILWHTQLIVCAVNHGLILSLFKLIPCPIQPRQKSNVHKLEILNKI